MSIHENLQRQWQMLRPIPPYPFKITAEQLFEKLSYETYEVTKRTVERDLIALSESFPILSNEREKPSLFCSVYSLLSIISVAFENNRQRRYLGGFQGLIKTYL